MSVRIADDCFVAQWVVDGAPFAVGRSKLHAHSYVIVDKRHCLHDYGLTHEAAIEKVNQLNEMAAAAMMMEGVLDGLGTEEC